MHASRPGILCFDGAINRRKAAVKRIESQVRPFYPAPFATLRSSALLAHARRPFLVPSRFFVPSSADVVKRPAPFARDCHCHMLVRSLVLHVPDLPHIITSLTSRLSDDRSAVTCFVVDSSAPYAPLRD